MQITINVVMKLCILEFSFLGNGDTSRNFSSKTKFTNGMKIKMSPMVKESVRGMCLICH